MAFADSLATSLHKNAHVISTPVTRLTSHKKGEQQQAVRGANGTGRAQSILSILIETHQLSLRPLLIYMIITAVCTGASPDR